MQQEEDMAGITVTLPADAMSLRVLLAGVLSLVSVMALVVLGSIPWESVIGVIGLASFMLVSRQRKLRISAHGFDQTVSWLGVQRPGSLVPWEEVKSIEMVDGDVTVQQLIGRRQIPTRGLPRIEGERLFALLRKAHERYRSIQRGSSDDLERMQSLRKQQTE